jgi:hypothetical protein
MIPHTRDRLLLAFADLAGYGLVARPAMAASPGQAHCDLLITRRLQHPGGLDSYVFWTAADDAAFGPDGERRRDLRLHTSGPEAAGATLEACRRAGVPALRDDAGGLVVSAAVPAVAMA